MFKFIPYLSHLTKTNKLAKVQGFSFGTCSGVGSLQDAVDNLRRASAFIIADTVCSGGTVKVGGAWMQRRTYTFFIIKRCKFGDEADREANLDICRELRRQLLSKMLKDQGGMLDGAWSGIPAKQRASFDLSSVQTTEYNDIRLDNACGLYVMVNSDEPINMAYNASEWE